MPDARFADFAEALRDIAAASGRLEKADRLGAFLKDASDDDAARAARYASGRVFPLADERTVDVGFAAIRTAVAALTETDADELRAALVRLGDPGDVAAEAIGERPGSALTLGQIEHAFEAIAGTRGSKARAALVGETLGRLGTDEARFFVRLLSGDLRTGMGRRRRRTRAVPRLRRDDRGRAAGAHADGRHRRDGRDGAPRAPRDGRNAAVSSGPLYAREPGRGRRRRGTAGRGAVSGRGQVRRHPRPGARRLSMRRARPRRASRARRTCTARPSTRRPGLSASPSSRGRSTPSAARSRTLPARSPPSRRGRPAGSSSTARSCPSGRTAASRRSRRSSRASAARRSPRRCSRARPSPSSCTTCSPPAARRSSTHRSGPAARASTPSACRPPTRPPPTSASSSPS